MTQPHIDWDSTYQHSTPPPWSIGAPQPELAALIEGGLVHGEVLDAGCGHAALSLALAAAGYPVVGLDASATAIAAASAAAAERGLANAAFAQADITDFDGYDGRFDTVLDSGLMHALPVERRQDYLRCIHRAAAPGARLFILAFAREAFGDERPGPNGFTADEMRQAVAALWTVTDVRPATLYANDTALADGPGPVENPERDDIGRLKMPGLLLSAQKRA